METLFLETIKEAGPVIVCLGFFIWRDYKREENQSQRAVDQTTFVQKTLVEMVERVTTALANNTAAMEGCIGKQRKGAA